jgi:hypothetical protein
MEDPRVVASAKEQSDRERAEEVRKRERRADEDHELLLSLQREQTTAQTTQANFTKVIAALTFVGFFVSTLQFCAAKRSADASERASKAAEDAVAVGRGQLIASLNASDSSDAQSRDAMENSNAQSLSALNASREALRLDQRAWVGFSGITEQLRSDISREAGSAMTNTGKTPARNVEAVLGLFSRMGRYSPPSTDEKWMKSFIAWAESIDRQGNITVTNFLPLPPTTKDPDGNDFALKYDPALAPAVIVGKSITAFKTSIGVLAPNTSKSLIGINGAVNNDGSPDT